MQTASIDIAMQLARNIYGGNADVLQREGRMLAYAVTVTYPHGGRMIKVTAANLPELVTILRTRLCERKTSHERSNSLMPEQSPESCSASMPTSSLQTTEATAATT